MKIIQAIIISLILLFSTTNVYGQTCRIEFYLLKKVIMEDSSSSNSIVSDFHVTLDDLEDSPFITDNEIISFSILKDTIHSKIRERHIFELPKTVVNRINGLKIPLCCGVQFALLVNGEIVYGGYFWNLFSSFGCNGIGAFANNDKLEVFRRLPDFGSEDNVWDIRRNSKLFDCLEATNRK